MKYRGPIGALSALVLAGLGVVVVSSTAAATENADCKTGSVQIVDRPDSGAAGNWALDTFTRTFDVCRMVEPTPDPSAVAAQKVEVESWTYLVKGTDEGTFKTQGTHTPAGVLADPVKFSGRTGQFNGKWSLKVEAPAEWQFWKGGYFGNDKNTSEWIAALWSDGVKPVEEFKDWSWTYTLCGKATGPTLPGTRWVNAATGNSGDITGKYDCAKPEITFTQAACGEDYKLTPAKLVVKNTKHFTPFWVRFNWSTPVKLKPGETATHEFTSGYVVLKINGKFVHKYVYDAPVCSSPSPTPTNTVSPEPTPTATTSPTTAAPTSSAPATSEVPVPVGNETDDGGSLAKTGTPTLLITGGGLALLAVGGLLLLLTIRRRREDTTQTAQFPAVQ